MATPAERVGDFWGTRSPDLRGVADRLRGGPKLRAALLGLLREADQPHQTKPRACAHGEPSHLGLSTDVFHPPGGLRSPCDAAANTLRGLRQRSSPAPCCARSVDTPISFIRTTATGGVSLRRVRLQPRHRGRDVGPRHRSYLRSVAPDRRARVPSRRARSSALRRASPRHIGKPVVSATDKEHRSRRVADPPVAIVRPPAASMQQGA
jgi:hypothetical protein